MTTDTVCVSYMNKLIVEMKLQIPLVRYLADIEMPHLVEIHCRLVGLNFNEYTPTPNKPWKDIQDIILSLQDRFGQGNFSHLNPRLIAHRNPKHTLCLLQIFNEIYEYYKKKGHNFTTPVEHDTTWLDSTHHTTRNETSYSSDTDEDRSIAHSSPGASDSSATFEEHRFVIPISDSELDDEVAGATFSELNSIQDLSGRRKSGSQSGYLAETDETPQKPRTAQDRIPTSDRLSKSKQKGSRVEETPLELSKGTVGSTFHGPTAIAARKRPSESPFFKSQNKAVKTGVQKKNNFKVDGDGQTKPKGKVIATGIITEGLRSSATASKSNITSFTQDDFNDEDECDDGGELQEDSLLQLNAIHNEIQRHIKDQLNKMEREIGTLKARKDCCRKPLTSFQDCQPKVQKTPRYDYFGNPIKQRFPLYTSSIIIPTCHDSDLRLKRKGKTSMSAKKDRVERAERVAKETDKELKNFQEFYVNELTRLKGEYTTLRKEFGPKAEGRFRNIKEAYRKNIKQEINRCVDKIIQRIASIYEEP